MFVVIIIAGILFVSIVGITILYLITPPPRPPLPSELQFIDFTDPKHSIQSFPSLMDDDSLKKLLDLSIIVPAHKEVDRLPGMLDKTLKYLKVSKYSNSFEIIVVDDGSHDETYSLLL